MIVNHRDRQGNLIPPNSQKEEQLDHGFSEVVQNALDVICSIDAEGKFVRVSPASHKVWGYRPEELVGQRYIDLVAPADVAKTNQAAQDIMAGKALTDFENRYRHKDGSLVDVLWSASWSEADQLMFCVARDITGRKRAEAERDLAFEALQKAREELETRVQERTSDLMIVNEYLQNEIAERERSEQALRESEERFRLIVEGVQDYGIFMLGPEGHIAGWNLGAERIKGYTEEEVIGRHFSLFYTPEDVARGHPQEELRRAAAQGWYEEEGWRVRKDGSRFWANVVITALRDAAGDLRGFSKVSRDVTQRRQAEEALRRSEERFQRAIAGADAVLYERDFIGGVYTFIGEGIFGLTGYRVDEFSPARFDEIRQEIILLGDEAGSDSAEAQARARRGALPEWRADYRIRTRSGQTRWLTDASIHLRDAEGNVVGSLGILQDITERKQAEEQTRCLQAQVLQSEKLAALGELVAGVAHEINNPLAVILGNAELLQMHPDAQVQEDAQAIRSMGERAARIVRSLLTFARKEQAGRRPGTLNQVVEQALEMCAYKLRKANLEVTLRLEESAPAAVLMNASEIEQVLLNLISNAEHALRNKEGDKRLVISAAVAEIEGTSWATVSVEDNGCGIPEEVLGRIFDPFFTTKDVGEGTGLGLSICHGIVKAHGGTLSVDSTPGVGTTFTLALPIAAETICEPPVAAPDLVA